MCVGRKTTNKSKLPSPRVHPWENRPTKGFISSSISCQTSKAQLTAGWCDLLSLCEWSASLKVTLKRSFCDRTVDISHKTHVAFTSPANSCFISPMEKWIYCLPAQREILLRSWGKSKEISQLGQAVNSRNEFAAAQTSAVLRKGSQTNLKSLQLFCLQFLCLVLSLCMLITTTKIQELILTSLKVIHFVIVETAKTCLFIVLFFLIKIHIAKQVFWIV